MKTYWIEYINKGIAHITDQQPDNPKYRKTKTTHVNELSKIVSDFNLWLSAGCGYAESFDVKQSRLFLMCRNL
jgi:hypothetical protein